VLIAKKISKIPLTENILLLTTVGKVAQTRRYLKENSGKLSIDFISFLPYPHFMKILRTTLNGWTDLKEQIYPIVEGTVQIVLADLGADLRKMYVSLWT